MKKQKTTLGIIAGNGNLPRSVIKACEKQGRPYFVVGLKGHADPNLIPHGKGTYIRVGTVGKIIKTCHKANVKEIVFIGGVRRPSVAEIIPDLKAFMILCRIGFRLLGDDSLLKLVVQEAEHNGLRVVGVDSIVPELLAESGLYGCVKPTKTDIADIQRGVQVAKALGQVDVGQAVIVQHGLVLSVEGIEGTAELIKRTAGLKRKGGGGVLVKVCKPNQEKRVDLPTIGPQTVQAVYEAGLKGIAIESGAALIAESQKVIALADKLGIFVVGVKA